MAAGIENTSDAIIIKIAFSVISQLAVSMLGFSFHQSDFI